MLECNLVNNSVAGGRKDTKGKNTGFLKVAFVFCLSLHGSVNETMIKMCILGTSRPLIYPSLKKP